MYGAKKEGSIMSKIKITLKSDLCAASGDGFSSVIDTDVCYDRYGFPVIGGRRIKGCLRDAAQLIGTDTTIIECIFGKSGADSGGSLKISDAHIKGYDELKDNALNHSAEEIISLFTYTRSATAIENDTAKDGSLRFTRVVKHYSPVDKKELEFFADVSLDEKYEDEFEKVCKALRNIGYKRNRGYGAIKCEFIKEKSVVANKSEALDDCKEYLIDYTIMLESNVMLPGNSSDESTDFIPGGSVLGFFANEYLKTHSADSAFEEMFLKNNIIFSNLYISDRNGGEYFPAPVILGKIKGEKGTFNIINYNAERGIIKPVKSGYCDFRHDMIKPLTETVYHHSTKDKSTLYTQTSLCAGQYFRGTIIGKGKYLKEIYSILTGSELHFGRSKSAQYSLCRLVKSEINQKPDEKISIKKGEKFIVLMLSDILICDNAGGYDITVEGLKNAIGRGIEKLICDNGLSYYSSALRYRTIGGYNTKINLQKAQIRTIASGSTLVFTAEEDMLIDKKFAVGAKQNEGFGKVLVCKANDIPNVIDKKTENNIADEYGILSGLISDNKLIEEMREKAIRYVKKYSEKDIINPAQLGRYAMMVENAESLDGLKTMAEKIKSSQSKKYFSDLIENSNAENYSSDVIEGKEIWREYLTLILTLLKYLKRGAEK